jgi:hypothetical protein
VNKGGDDDGENGKGGKKKKVARNWKGTRGKYLGRSGPEEWATSVEIYQS